MIAWHGFINNQQVDYNFMLSILVNRATANYLAKEFFLTCQSPVKNYDRSK